MVKFITDSKAVFNSETSHDCVYISYVNFMELATVFMLCFRNGNPLTQVILFTVQIKDVFSNQTYINMYLVFICYFSITFKLSSVLANTSDVP